MMNLWTCFVLNGVKYLMQRVEEKDGQFNKIGPAATIVSRTNLELC